MRKAEEIKRLTGVATSGAFYVVVNHGPYDPVGEHDASVKMDLANWQLVQITHESLSRHFEDHRYFLYKDCRGVDEWVNKNLIPYLATRVNLWDEYDHEITIQRVAWAT